MNIKELRNLAKKRGLRRYSHLRKAELQKMLGLLEKKVEEACTPQRSFSVDNLFFCNECKETDIMVVNDDRWCAECGSGDLRVLTPEMKAKMECSALHKEAQKYDPLEFEIYWYHLGLAYKQLTPM